MALTINAGVDQAIYTTQQATLSATASGGGTTKTYTWSKTSGPNTSFGSTSAASTTFTPTGGAGTYVLRCTVTDGTETAFDELTVAVSATPTTTTYASITSSTGWIATGGTVQAVLADGLDTTFITSPNAPSGALIDGTLGPVTAPSAGQDFVVTVRAMKVDATSGSLICRLYNGSTLVSTVNVASVPDAFADLTVTFPAAEVANMPTGTWAIGARLTIAATAS